MRVFTEIRELTYLKSKIGKDCLSLLNLTTVVILRENKLSDNNEGQTTN